MLLRRPVASCLVLVAAALAVYLPDVGHGFVKDDFLWIAGSRLSADVLLGAPTGVLSPRRLGLVRDQPRGLRRGLPLLRPDQSGAALRKRAGRRVSRARRRALGGRRDRRLGHLDLQLARHQHGDALDQRAHGAAAHTCVPRGGSPRCCAGDRSSACRWCCSPCSRRKRRWSCRRLSRGGWGAAASARFRHANAPSRFSAAW